MAGIGEIDVEVTDKGETLVISVAGEVDLVTAPHLRRVLSESSAQKGVHCIVLDLAGVSFLDSTGIAVLAGSTKRCRDLGQDVRLCCVQPQLSRLFALMGLDRHWQVFDSLDKAVDAQ